MTATAGLAIGLLMPLSATAQRRGGGRIPGDLGGGVDYYACHRN